MLSFGRRMFVSSALVACAFAAVATDATEAHARGSSLVGTRLGRNRSGEELKITREVGSGFTSRWQASAAVRMTGSEAVLVKTYDGKWHACATTANGFDGITPADYSGIQGLVPLVSPKNLAGLRQSTPKDETYFSFLFGVEERDVRIGKESDRQAGFINVTAGLPYPGMHGPQKMLDQGFLIGAPSAIQIDRAYADKKDPRLTAAVLFHESSHLADYELAQSWAERFKREKNRPAMKNADVPEFVTWIVDTKRGLPRDDARTIADVVRRDHSSTEARAYIGTFIAALQAGAGDVAKTQLVTYATGDAVKQPPAAIVQDALESDLDKAYATLDAQGKKDFDAAIAAAKTASSGAWISKYKRGAGRRA